MITTDDMVNAICDALRKQDASVSIHQNDGSHDSANLEQFASDLIDALADAGLEHLTGNCPSG